MAESETPRTNAKSMRFEIRAGAGSTPMKVDGEWTHADFSRQLERELHLKDQKVAELETAFSATDVIVVAAKQAHANAQIRAEDAHTRAESLQAKVAELESERRAWLDTDNAAKAIIEQEKEIESLQSQLDRACPDCSAPMSKGDHDRSGQDYRCLVCSRTACLQSQLAAAQENARRNTLRELSRELNKLKWIGSDDGWDMAIRSVREHIDASIDAAQGDPS